MAIVQHRPITSTQRFLIRNKVESFLQSVQSVVLLFASTTRRAATPTVVSHHVAVVEVTVAGIVLSTSVVINTISPVRYLIEYVHTALQTWHSSAILMVTSATSSLLKRRSDK